MFSKEAKTLKKVQYTLGAINVVEELMSDMRDKAIDYHICDRNDVQHLIGVLTLLRDTLDELEDPEQ